MADDGVIDDASMGMKRLQEILKEMHPQTAEIVTGHVALERELHRLLQNKFVNPTHLKKLKTIHAIAVLKASTTEKWAELVLEAAEAFIRLRNAVAHGNEGSARETALTKLLDAMEKIGGRPNPATVQYGSVAIVIIAALHVAFGEEPVATA